MIFSIFFLVLQLIKEKYLHLQYNNGLILEAGPNQKYRYLKKHTSCYLAHKLNLAIWRQYMKIRRIRDTWFKNIKLFGDFTWSKPYAILRDTNLCQFVSIFRMMQLILIPPNFLSSSLVCDTWSGSTVLYSNNLLTSRLICVVKYSSKSTFYLIFHCVLCMLF